jgi:hypothetical protein
LASELKLPSSVTVLLSLTFWVEPALATGAALTSAVEMVTKAKVLSLPPSLTFRLAT